MLWGHQEQRKRIELHKAPAIRQEKEVKYIQVRKEEIKLSHL
jgi:hypothetical protein